MIIRNCVALVRGNFLCVYHKVLSPKKFKYHCFIRIFERVRVSIRKKGCIHFGNNVKLDSYAAISSYGGNIYIGNKVGIGRNSIIVSQEKITIGEGTMLAPNVLIYDHDHEYDNANRVEAGKYRKSAVSIGKNCWIGANTIILRGTVIGDNCIIGAGSVIKGVFPSNCKIIQRRETTVIGD